MIKVLIIFFVNIPCMMFTWISIPLKNNLATVDPDSSADNSTSSSLPPMLQKANFFDYLEKGETGYLYEQLLKEYNGTVHDLEGKADEEKKKLEDFKTQMKRKIFPFRMCCEPQFLRYYINYAKELSGVRKSNVLFFLNEHRLEWIEKINQNKGKHSLAGRLEQGISRANMSVEEFVNETDIMDMRASSAIHSYLSRTVRPMTAREQFAITRFTLTLFHGRVFNILAAAMKTPPINVTWDGIVKIPVCDEILDLESDEMKFILANVT